MDWLLPVSGGLVGVIGLLYGLLERSKRQASDRKADTFFAAYTQEQKDNEACKVRYERLIEHYKEQIKALRSDLNASSPPGSLRDRLNAVLNRRMPQEDAGNAGAGRLPSSTPSNDDSGSGSHGG